MKLRYQHHHYHHHHHHPSSCSYNLRRRFLSTHLLCSSSSTNNNSNEYLVQARIQARREKRQTRQKSLDEDRRRNLRIKRLIHTEAGSTTDSASASATASTTDNVTTFNIPKLYALRVSVDRQLRSELQLNGREKRGRVFIEMDDEGCTTIKGLKMELHSFFRCLKKSTYVLSASGVPNVLQDGSIDSPSLDDIDNIDNYEHGNDTENDNHNDPFANFVPLENDDDVVSIFQKAREYFEQHNSNLSADAPNRLKRPSLLVHVRKDPNAPVPPPPPKYLENMADPKESETMTMLSFYSFPEGGDRENGDNDSGNGGVGGVGGVGGGIKDPEEFGLFLRKVWRPFGALGRVYVAKEGVNAQMSIPTNV